MPDIKSIIKMWVKKIDPCFFSFFMAALTMWLTLSYAGVLKNGKFCILEGDLLEIYVPTIRGMYRDLLNFDNIYYSWSHSLGMNMALSLPFYGAFNPINIIFLIFYKADINVVVALAIVIKAGFSGIAFHLFSKHVLKINDLRTTVFSTFYAMCAFQLSFNIINFIWMDALYVFPMVLLSIYLLAKHGNPVPLILSYTYIFIAQFYMGYVVGIVSLIFFVGSIFLIEINISKRRYLLLFIFSVFIAILLSAIVWMPAGYFLLHHRAADSTDFFQINVNLFDVINQFFFSNGSGVYGMLPNLYCGVPTILLLIISVLFPSFRKQSIQLKEVLLFFIPFVFLIVSCFFLPLYRFLHAFDSPDGWYFRFSWATSFFACALALMGTKWILEVKGWSYLIISAALMVIYIIEIFWLQKRFPDEIVNTWLYFGINVALLLIWFFVFVLMQKGKVKNSTLWLLCLLLAFLECVGNGYTSFYKDESKTPSMPEYVYYTFEEDQKEVEQILTRDTSFYRINYLGGMITNVDSFSGFYGISDFETTENPNVRSFLSKIGLASSTRMVLENGLTDVSRMFLGVKYIVKGRVPAIVSTFEQGVSVEETKYWLPIGFMVSDEIKNVTFTEDAFANNNELISKMLGEKLEVFTEFEKDAIDIENHGLEIEKTEGDNYRFYSTEDAKEDYLEFVYADKAENDTELIPYIYFVNDSSVYVLDSMVIQGEIENLTETGGILSMSYIKKFDKNENKLYTNIAAFGRKEQGIKNYYLAFLDEAVFKYSHERLSENVLDVSEYSNGKVKGNVRSTSEKTVLFTSIPYDEGWNLCINGKKQDYIPLLDETFIGIELDEPGEYEIELSYSVGWLNYGFVMTGVGVVILVAYILFEKKRGKKFLYEKNEK